MKHTELLSAQLIDILFAGRNKSYGAYELRKTYSKRINTALFITLFFAAAGFGGAAIAGGAKNKIPVYKTRTVQELADIPEDKPKEPLPEPERRPEPEPVRTTVFNIPQIKPDDLVDNPLPEIASLDSSLIGDITTAGRPDDGEVVMQPPGKDKGIVELPVKDPGDEIVATVDVNAKFIGNWVNFLLKNLNAQVPIDHDAGPGRYSVIIQFVVDREGNVSEINPLTHHGFGMEEEAVRVIKKAPRWEPAIQNGYKVKAYHRQVITFDVLGE